jgi:hypothetical protein
LLFVTQNLIMLAFAAVAAAMLHIDVRAALAPSEQGLEG